MELKYNVAKTWGEDEAGHGGHGGHGGHDGYGGHDGLLIASIDHFDLVLCPD